MDLSKYMTFRALWSKLDKIDEDLRAPVYSEPVSIACFIYGKDIFIRDKDASSTVSAKVYLVLDPVKPHDILDGQVVKSVKSYPESWDPSIHLYEVLTWED